MVSLDYSHIIMLIDRARTKA